jgi:hypothetical protein
MADMIVGKYAKIAGYQRTYTGWDFFLFLEALPWLLYGFTWNFFRKVTAYLPYGLRMALRNFSPALPRFLWRIAQKKQLSSVNHGTKR